VRRVVAVYVAYAVVFTAFLVASFTQAEGYEEGAFPDRVFYIVRSPPGGLQSDVYVTYVWPAVPGEWSLRLVRLSGPFVTVKIYEESPGVPFLIGQWRLGRTGQELGPVLLQADVRYRLEFTAQGRPGTSILAERFESNDPPIACFTYYPSNPTVNDGVTFDGSCSFDPDGDPLAYHWDFGDGQTSQERYVSIGYRSPGTFAVTLWVLDGIGGSANTTQIVTVASETSQFNPPHHDFPLDEDGDGLFDVLVLRVNVSVGARDPYVDYYGPYYRLSAYFQAGNQSLWDDRFSSYAPGPVTIELRFRGVGIRLGGASGPYLVYLTFVHSPTNTVLDEDVHVTRAYDPTSFQAPPASFEPPYSDTAIDADGDGQFEELAIDLGVRVEQAGTYFVWGWLYTREPVRDVGFAEVSMHLEPGWASVRLTYSGIWINTSDVDGPYRADVYLRDDSLSLDNVTVWTAAYDRRSFAGPRVSFFGTHDDYGVDVDGDGLFEFLELNLSVVAKGNASFSIEATLTGVFNETSDYYIDRTYAYGDLTEGVQKVSVRFRSEPINVSQFDGPYHVYLTISSYSGHDSDLYTTHAYDRRQFRGPVARVTGPLADYGLDTDQDGRFNYMVVEVPVQVYYRAELILSGWTINPCCPNVAAGNVSTYEPGTYRLRLWFDGVELRLLGYVGSFTIRLYLIDNSTHRDLYFEDYVTAGYRYEWFEEPPAAFAPPHAEYGLDTDGDGRYNFLVIEAVVDVREADTYILSVRVESSYYGAFTFYGSNVSALAPGIHRLRVLFDTVPLNASRLNTSYRIALSLSSDSHNVVFAYDSFGTRFYNYTAFEEIPFLLAPPHRDYALDTDGDGLFNQIVVEVVLSVLEPGTVWLNAALYTSSEIVHAFNQTEVEPGNPVVTLRFDTYRLLARGASGPYWIEFTLYGGAYGRLDRGTHITAAYQADRFDPPVSIDVSRTTDFGQDVDGNGLYDYLVVGVVVELAAPGYYRLEAFIAFDQRTYVSGYADFYLDPGRHVVNVSFRGVSLWAAGRDGPYAVNVTVHQFYPGTAVHATYTTSAYAWSDFEPTGAMFSGALGETPFDADGDGLYDLLFVNATIEVRISGNYSVGACLDVDAGYCRLNDFETRILPEGSHVVSLELLGGAIHALGIDGPYNVTVVLSPVAPGTQSPEWTLRRSFLTAAYRHTDFDIVVAFESITDRGVDTNGNGRFEYLEISIVVLVEAPSRYSLEAALELAPWHTAYVRFEGDLAVGRLTLTLRFEAYLFNATGQDGPYPLRILLYAYTLGIVVEATHETMAYRVADFEY